MSTRSVPPSHLCCIMSEVSEERKCAFLRRSMCSSIVGMNKVGLSSGSSVRHSIRSSVRTSCGVFGARGSRSRHLLVISILISVPDSSLRNLVRSSIRP